MLYEFFNEGCKEEEFYRGGPYFIYPNFEDRVGFLAGNHTITDHHLDKYAPGYTEITFETFKEHVLKSTETLTIKTNKTMKKERFTIEASIPLKEAFVKEAKLVWFDEGAKQNGIEHYSYVGPTSVSHPNTVEGMNAKNPVHFVLIDDWYKALEYMKEYFAKDEIEIAGYKAEFSKDEVAFGCNHLTTKDLKTLKDMMILSNKLDCGIQVYYNNVSVIGAEERKLTPELIDKLLEGIKAFGK